MPIPSSADFREVKYTVDDSYKNFVLVQPPIMPDDMPFDPWGQMMHILTRDDWGKYSPTGRCSAIIVDTFSEFCEDIGRFVATAGRGNAGIGESYGLDPDEVWEGTTARVTQQNDYGKTQELMSIVLRTINRTRQFPHVIVLGHRKAITEEKMERQANGKFAKVIKTVGYDMNVPGRKWLGQMTKFFEQYLFQTNEGFGGIDIRLHLRGDGLHTTKFRSTKEVEPEIEVGFSYEKMVEVIRKVAQYSGVDMGSPDYGLRLCSYGDGGTGKSMLWTSLPPETFEVGPALYLSYDPSASRLTSVWDELREKK